MYKIKFNFLWISFNLSFDLFAKLRWAMNAKLFIQKLNYQSMYKDFLSWYLNYILFFQDFSNFRKTFLEDFLFRTFPLWKKDNKTERLNTYEYIGPKASRSSRSCGREWESLCCRSTGGIDRCELQVKYKTLTSSRQNERYSASMSKYGIKNLKVIF